MSEAFPTPPPQPVQPEVIETKKENIKDRLFGMLGELGAEFTEQNLEQDKATLQLIRAEISKLSAEFRQTYELVNAFVQRYENRQASFEEVFSGYRPSTNVIR